MAVRMPTTKPPARGTTATSTDAVHGGDARVKAFDALSQPVVQTSTYAFADTRELIAMKEGTHPRGEREEYGRYGNPTTRAVEGRMAALEGTEDSLLFSSGMAALTTAVLALVEGGQHVVLFRDAYRMTREFVTGTLRNLGVSHTLLDHGDLASLEHAIRPDTRVVLAESPTNPRLSCIDLARLAHICKANRVRSLVDATFATPYNCRPADFGVDLIVHSATKYLAGHNDVLAGTVSGSSGLIAMIRDLRGILGPVCDPHAAFLVGRGIKTLGLRVERQNATGLAVARHLERHHAIEKVYYPGLLSHPDHAIAAEQMAGFGGVVSFVMRGGLGMANRLVDRMKLARIAPSFGGVESLVEVPAVMSYFGMAPEDRERLGIVDGLVRLSVGIEDAADVVSDLDQALR
jgi:cystathionine gamma-synthase